MFCKGGLYNYNRELKEIKKFLIFNLSVSSEYFLTNDGNR